MKEQVLAFITLVSTAIIPVSSGVESLVSPVPKTQILAEHTLDLGTRNKNAFVNEVFVDNILLALHYLKGDTNILVYSDGVNWEKVGEPFEVSFTLEPGEVFAFHDSLLEEYRGLNVKTGKTKYTQAEGYKTVGGLSGNGVCHLASLINWTASNAGLEVTAKVNHNFLPVPGVPKEFGTSIRYSPNGGGNSQNQNLYLKNNFDFPVIFVFTASGREVNLKITK